MKVHLNRAELAEALAPVASIAGTRTPKPILQCTLLRAFGDYCTVSATDHEIGVRMVLTQVEVGKQGQVLVSADKLGQIVRESADEVLLIESDENVCHVKGQASHFQIVLHDPEEFPPVAEMEGAPDFEVETSVLKRLSEWTSFAAARESTRYAINGVLWEKQGNRLTLVATDGRRLSRAVGQTRGAEEANARAIVPSKAMQLFQRMLSNDEGAVAVKISENQILLRTTGATLSATLVEGQFPKFEEVIPTDCNNELELSTGEFLSAVKQAALLTNEESKGVRFSLARNNLTLSSRAPEQGEAQVSIPVKYSGEAMDIGFNPVFLIEVLRVVHTDSIVFRLKEPRRPGLLTCGDDLLYVIMPVNIS